MAGIVDRLADLSWIGPDFVDQGWFIVGDAPADPVQSTEADLAWEAAKKLLRESDWTMLSDVPMSAGNKAAWIEYRRALREIRLQPGFPLNIQWPLAPQ